ncbi:EF-P 5-aminopentanol modification-associated protein YfmH [Pediococcus ethanolidurans]|uniref:EF-P 5-aminopentanol modification-associated protein YfmH n=1 Tax=Pediococcus ethanolidurans TaxID=319653 RepID=UPI001C1ED78F|nr:pitrilysin family protein [Pediococcus ethanolidurans]MBU7554273.1 insulinase family protein [Pediococcus ethanolidurans]MCT4397398.1 insulinase family protein [Pediococcus ethanolidurans]MCV3321154.1 insulinase family protein [Pediococcus ethanolidurans]MCV3323097.1 insulinase family protein [Pediococcus ethanolidurans]MCV3326956.1 insulinase family protein [Pediococcus ethanolidurans]
MHKRVYKQFNETLYSETLTNGLRVNILPKKGFHKTYSTFSTNFGSIDRTFIPLGQSDYVTQPAGIAHFLEHKMFDKKGYDAFDLFGKYGADSNAFTSFTKTSYLFSATQNIHENLDILLNFVQEPYFTKESVAKEKGIIGQEIQMYDDDPDWKLYMGILGNLYPHHPVHLDIAGTVASIAEITVDDLYTAYQTFYHPANMDLFVVGNIDPEETLTWIKENQAKKSFMTFEEPKVKLGTRETGNEDITKQKIVEMAVNRPKSVIGLKGLDVVPIGVAGLSYRLKANLLLYLLFGESSEQYLKLYDQGIIDDTFSYEFDMERSFHYISFSGDTDKPTEFIEAIRTILQQADQLLPQLESQFELAKKEMLGRLLQRMDSIEAIANSYEGRQFGYTTVFDQTAIYENMTLGDLTLLAPKLFNLDGFSTFQIQPMKGQKA